MHLSTIRGSLPQIKGGSRAKRLSLINKYNPDWKDLYDAI